jgi:hypothetical protein
MYDTALTAHEPAGSLKRAAELKDHCADQLAWELHVSRGYAFSQVLLGEALVRRLPLVLADFQAGLIDQARAGVFVDCLSNLDLDTAREIAERYRVKARTLHPGPVAGAAALRGGSGRPGPGPPPVCAAGGRAGRVAVPVHGRHRVSGRVESAAAPGPRGVQLHRPARPRRQGPR